MQSLLTESEAGEVLSVLKGSVDKNFESVTLSFGLLFQREADRFRACCGLVWALLESSFLDPRQRLFALYALLELHRDRPRTRHPFWEFLIATGTAHETPPEEVEIIHVFLVQGRGAELLRRNVNEYLNSVYATPANVLVVHKAELTHLRREVMHDSRGMAALSRVAVPRAFLESTDAKGVVPRVHQAEIFEAMAKHVNLEGYEPTYTRPAPPLAPPLRSECRWRDARIEPALMWDCGEKNPSEEVLLRFNGLLQEAKCAPLTAPQQKQMLQDLEEDPKVIFRCSLEAEALPLVVEHAPSVASEILRLLLQTPSGFDFLSSLQSMTMSLHSMEVVNSLATTVALPEDFVQGYISNCIASCNAIEDRYMQSRLVRLVCVFLQSLIKMGIVDMTNLTHEVQAFCIDHSRIREAAGLFRMLKQMENETDAEGSSSL